MSAQPVASFTSKDVLGCLDAFGAQDNSITTNPIVVYLQGCTSEGVRASSGNTTYAIAKGMLVIDQIPVSQGAIGTITGTIYAISADGATSPYVVTEGSESLAANTAVAEVASLGTVTINGTALNDVIGWTVNFNNQVQTVTSNGRNFPTFSNLIRHAPTIEIQTMDAGQLRTLGTSKAAKLNGTTGLVLTLKTSTSGIMTATVGNTLTIKNGLFYAASRPSGQGSLTTASLTVVAATDLSTAALVIS
jgi:hypothetical protein